MSLMNYKVTNQLIMAASQLSIIVKQADMVFLSFFILQSYIFCLKKGECFVQAKNLQVDITYDIILFSLRYDLIILMSVTMYE